MPVKKLQAKASKPRNRTDKLAESECLFLQDVSFGSLAVRICHRHR
jgi:hypothetical protein